MSCFYLCSVALPHGAMGPSAVCESYSITFEYNAVMLWLLFEFYKGIIGK